jgi:hypothetical protein
MRKLATLFAAAALAICPAAAMAQSSDNGLQVVPLGYCQLSTVSSSTSLSSCAGGIPARATRAVISAEAQAIRYRDDGTAPTATVGMPLAVAQLLVYTGSLSKMLIIEQTASAKVNVLFYR